MWPTSVCLALTRPCYSPINDQWNSTWYFIYTTNASVIDGGSWWYDASSMPGLLRQDNNLCSNNILPKGIGCSALFRDDHMYWNMPQLRICCTCYSNLSITGVDWIVNSTYEGVTNYNITNTTSYLWSRPIFQSPYYETVPSAANNNQRRKISPPFSLSNRANIINHHPPPSS